MVDGRIAKTLKGMLRKSCSCLASAWVGDRNIEKENERQILEIKLQLRLAYLAK